MKPQDAWLATQGQLELQLNRATYDTWVRDCKFASFADSVFTLSVRNAYAKDWLEQRLYRSLRHTLSGIFQQEIEIEFVVSKSKQQNDFTAYDDDQVLPLLSGVGKDNNRISDTYYNDPFFDWPSAASDQQENLAETWNPCLNPDYTFDRFIVGPSNQMAQAAAHAVTRSPAKAYNPLFIYGDVGLGKTHLLQAIGNACAEKDLKVLYTTCEQFTNKLIEAIRNKTTADFRDYYRRVDVLLVDDIQFIAGKESTQEEFFHTFNALHAGGSQIVLASDRQPKAIRGLEKRLVSRLEWGLVVDIQRPAFETRLAILRNKAELQNQHLPQDVADYIATNVKGNIRELEGALTQVIAFSELTHNRLSTDIAEQVLSQQRGHYQQKRVATPIILEKRHLSVEEIVEGTAHVFEIPLKELIGKSRTKDIAQARQCAIYVAREETHASWPEIGGVLGGRNHSTILYSYNKVADQLTTDPDLRQKVDNIRQKIYNSTLPAETSL